MKKLLLITDNFPFGNNEATFVLPELPALTERFEVVIAADNVTDAQTSDVPEQVRVIRVNGSRRIRKVTGRLKALFDPMFYRECRRIIKAGKLVPARLKWCISFYSAGESFAKELRSQLRKLDWQPDIIYTYWHMTPTFGVARRKKWFGDPKVVSRAHGRDLYSFRRPLDYQAFKQESDRLLDEVYLVSDTCRQYYRSSFSVSDPPKCKVARLGFDNTLRAQWHSGGKVEIVSCSGAIKLKRVDLIIEALALIHDVQIEWTHIGGGELLEELKTLAAQKLSDKDNIKFNFVGKVPNEKVREIYTSGNFKYFVTATETEGLPVSVIEAYSFGIPAIATAVGGIPEIVDSTNGILLPADLSAEQLADAIRSAAYVDNERYAEMRDAAYIKWKSAYVASDNAARFADRLLEICDK